MSVAENEIFLKKPVFKSEDWWAVWLGLLIFILGLGPIFGVDLLGWVVKQNVWVDISKSIAPFSKTYQGLPGIASALLTYLFLLVITTLGSWALGSDIKKFVIGFSIIYWITFASIILGNNAFLAATPDKQASFKIPWSLSLGELGFVFALIIGLIIGNFFTGFTRYLKEATRPEWFIKTGIVILGAAIGIKTVGALGLAGTVIGRGVAAVLEAYLIYWPVVYFVARKFFKFTPEWAAPLASGASICGVSAAIATGSAIRSRPHIPAVISSVIIVFVAIELLFLPWLAQLLLYHQPLVAGSWMGLAVKSDGGALASGAITDVLVRAKALTALGIKWEDGWILMATTTTKIFIDVFIGVWAFVLAIIWSVFRIDKRQSQEAGVKVSVKEIWDRFPKFIIGFVLTFLILLVAGLLNPEIVKNAQAGSDQANALRTIFFALCFFSIGLVTNVRRLVAEGVGRVVAAYAASLFFFILWVGLLISWIFYHGITPPVIG